MIIYSNDLSTFCKVATYIGSSVSSCNGISVSTGLIADGITLPGYSNRSSTIITYTCYSIDIRGWYCGCTTYRYRCRASKYWWCLIIVHEVNPGTGCSTYTLTVGVPRDPAAITAVPAAVVCNGTSTLTASVANSYLWSPGGQTTQSIVTPPLFNATNYNVTLGYGNNGCTDVASTTVTVSSAPPTVTCSPNIVTNNTIGQCGKTITYTTTSGGTPAPTITYSLTGATTGSGNGDGSGSFFNVGVTNVTVIATNACGTASCSFTVTINDTQNPTLTCPAPVTVSCASAVPTPDINDVTGVSDNCAGTVTITWQGDAISNQTCANRYTITRTYRATDVCGNFAECTQIITVNDQTAPVILSLIHI